MIKIIATLVFSFYCLSPATAQDIQDVPEALQKEYESEIQVMRNIFGRLFEYEIEYAEFPESLVTLVMAKYLKATELHIKLEGGAVQIPNYYPGRSSSGGVEPIILTFDIPDSDKRISVNLQGTITIKDKPKKPNKAEMATPSKPSD